LANDSVFYTLHWKLMKSIGSHGCSSLLVLGFRVEGSCTLSDWPKVLIVNVTFKSLLWGFLHNFIAMGSSKWWLFRTVDWHSRDHHCAGCFWSTFPHGQGSNRTKPASQNGFNQGEVTSINSFMLSAYDNPRPPINSFALTVCCLILQQRQSWCSWILIDILVSLYRSVWCSCKNLRKEYSLLRVEHPVIKEKNESVP